ncbi:hypothetical protein [Micromonospora sp. LOL_021]|uniref:hypothetical protein n=1 Tax=Micromonospora sp. LOL_021 TaxID=3345417 RepID=UPI003A8754D7
MNSYKLVTEGPSRSTPRLFSGSCSPFRVPGCDIRVPSVERAPLWHYSVGFDVTDNVRTAITKVPAGVWAPALTAEGTVRSGAHVTELTEILDLADGWPDKMRTLARTEPLHPKHRKQASEIEKRRGQRFQAVATDLPGHHYPKLDAFHRGLT